MTIKIGKFRLQPQSHTQMSTLADMTVLNPDLKCLHDEADNFLNFDYIETPDDLENMPRNRERIIAVHVKTRVLDYWYTTEYSQTYLPVSVPVKVPINKAGDLNILIDMPEATLRRADITKYVLYD